MGGEGEVCEQADQIETNSVRTNCPLFVMTVSGTHFIPKNAVRKRLALLPVMQSTVSFGLQVDKTTN
jgi:hypothetical protein